ncbi:hypothetical protein B0A49_00102 [Cryomyces minteri]|uniref:Sm domain-containing protein n=1 Tax=Cryomyces minteri TaxID=331657 RepID=A0A4U0Y016_9PEZI|nr:hypothetical protein B0A49_00102 [Cryomyces minteri]
MTSTIGIPIKLLNEATGHVITLEITSGQVYRGKLLEAEDNMNIQLKDITVTARDGRVSHLDQVYIRGSHVRFFIVPDMLRNAPMFRTRGTRGRGVGLARGRATVNRARGLTGSSPEQVADTSSTAGLSHTWSAQTAYYTATIPVWIDEIAELASWAAEFSKPEAREVVGAVGAWIYAFRKPTTPEELDTIKHTMRAIQGVIETACGYSWDGVCLAVATLQSITPHLERSSEEWEELCREVGFEYVDGEVKGENEFGEPVGVARVKEALEANDWAADEVLDVDALSDDDDTFAGTFAAEEVEMERELWGLKSAVRGADAEDASSALLEGDHAAAEDEASQVEELERMMLKMQAVKDMGVDLPEAERRRFAAKAVNDIMKTL